VKILFLTLYPEAAASPRYRVHQFIPYLRDHGMDCTVMAPTSDDVWRRHTGPNREGRAFWYHAHETPTRLRQIFRAGDYDVVFLQKAIMSAYLRGFDRLLERRCRRLILDIDDAVHLSPPHALRFPWSFLEDRRQLQRLLGGAERVLAGNSWLGSEVEAAGGRATHFPTVVDTGRFVPASAPPETYCVGWMGGPSTATSLNLIAPVLDELPAGELLVAGADAKEVHCSNAQFATWNYDTEVSLLQSFSVGLMPLSKNEWSRGKCALKALLYMAVGIPCIATPFGAVKDIIVHGENGWFADSPEEWREGLRALRDPGLRQRLGKAARATVETRYSLSAASPQLLHYLESSP
jgi:glycosyltransferase involved in cell wall biosynthesis